MAFARRLSPSAHRILIIAFCMLRDGTTYQEAGGDYFDRLNPDRTRTRLVRRLQRLGLHVILKPRIDSQEPAAGPPQRPQRGRPCKCFERAIPCIHGKVKIRSFQGLETAVCRLQGIDSKGKIGRVFLKLPVIYLSAREIGLQFPMSWADSIGSPCPRSCSTRWRGAGFGVWAGFGGTGWGAILAESSDSGGD